MSGETTWTDLAIPAGNYGGSEFITIVERILQTKDLGFTVPYDNLTGCMTVKNATKAFSLKVVSSNPEIAKRPSRWGIGYHMGIHERDVVTSVASGSSYVVAATSPLFTRPTPYYLLQLWCPESVEPMVHRVAKGGAVPAFAKLVLDGIKYTLQYINNADYMRKEYTFLTPVNVAQVRVKLLDPYGDDVDMRDIDWSLTLELYEIMNSRTYDHLINGFNR
jgi:hypothetical protein